MQLQQNYGSNYKMRLYSILCRPYTHKIAATFFFWAQSRKRKRGDFAVPSPINLPRIENRGISLPWVVGGCSMTGAVFSPLCWLLRTSVQLYSHLRAFACSLLRLFLLVDNLWDEYNWKAGKHKILLRPIIIFARERHLCRSMFSTISNNCSL